jgi:hypothetical protein
MSETAAGGGGSGGGSGGGGNKPGPIFWIIVAFVILFSNIIGVAVGQLQTVMQFIRFNAGTLLIIGGLIWVFKAVTK